jgi:hypothetical protein
MIIAQRDREGPFGNYYAKPQISTFIMIRRFLYAFFSFLSWALQGEKKLRLA